MLEPNTNLPEWCQSKITLAEDYISTVANYMTAEMNEEYIKESGGEVVFKKGENHIEKYGEDAFALYKNGKKQKYYTSIEAAKSAMNEEVEYLEEKNAPTNPALWSRAKALAKSKFDVYPSAYANGWAAKWYKSKGGGWKSVSEEVEQLDEMPGANMDTRAVHSHLKKKGWKLSRSSGSHDVYTHSEAEHHISVPRHKQLKAPLVKGILKQAEIKESEIIVTPRKNIKAPAAPGTYAHDLASGKYAKYGFTKSGKETAAAKRERMKKEEVEQLDEISQETKKSYVQKAKAEVKELKPHVKGEYGSFAKNIIARRQKGIKMATEQATASGAHEGRFISGQPKVPFKNPTIVSSENKKDPMQRVKELAKAAAKRQAGIKENMEPEDAEDKVNTAAKRSLSKTAGMVKDLAKKGKDNKKEKPETFQSEPELSSQIVKV
jgi:predicted RNA binding protein YcfA (HicA-like mRNA interferase family)